MQMSRTAISLKHSTITSRLGMLHSKWTPQERRRRAMEGRRKAAHFLRMIRVPQEPEIWATGSLMAIDLHRLGRELAAKSCWSGTSTESSESDTARLSSGF